MCRVAARILGVLSFSFLVAGLRYDPAYVEWNLNQNEDATEPVDYRGEWDNHTFHPSPTNWRFPFYTLTLDRFVDGDPSNNDANGTAFEHDWMTNQFRFGGDAKGLMGSLDYIQGMGVKALYLAGSPFINQPWSGDGYGPLDFTLLDAHHGVIEDWRALVADIHSRDMYIILDNTMGTMGDLVGFKESLNASAPFLWDEYDTVWKSDRRYHDFQPGNSINTSCQYPTMYGEDGLFLGNITDDFHQCRESEFDQYGDIKGVGAYPAWRTQLSKFASVQDRLRVWQDDVLNKINVMSCMQISMLDIDGFRMDKALQTTLDAHATFSSYQRQCARQHGKDNFLIVGEAVGEIPFSALYFGRGRTPAQQMTNVTASMLSSNETAPDLYMREWGNAALDAASFHYPTYGAMTRFLGLDGPIGFEGVDFVDHWTKLMQTDDMVNSNTGKFDPRHLYGMTNQDVFRWPSLTNGVYRQLLGLFITTLEMPGIPLTLWGEEQQFNVLENLADDYVFGRTPMTSSRAWQLHGCYQLGEQVYVDMPFDSANFTCHDDNVSLDHRDPSHPIRNILKRMYELRRLYPTLNDGFNLKTLSSRTYDTYLPGSGNLPSPMGIWSVYRGREMGVQDFEGEGFGNQGAWLVFQNENKTVDYSFDCSNNNTALISAFPANTTVKNLFYPYDEYTLEASNVTYNIEGSSELNGCLSNFTLPPWGYKAFVPKANWTTPAPTITRVIPSHDTRIESSVAAGEWNTVPIEIRFSSPMDCDSVRNSLNFSSTTHEGQVAQLQLSSINCLSVDLDAPTLEGAMATGWKFSANLTNVYNGVHTFTVNNASAQDGSYTNAIDHFMFRIGQTDNPIVFPATANYTRGVLQQNANGDFYVVPKAAGADKFRYSTNWGSSWSSWTDYTGQNYTITPQSWSGTKAQQWSGEHVILNFWSAKTGSSDHVQHSDLGRDNLPPRRWPHVSLEGSWNQYGYDNGLANSMKQDDNGLWNFHLMAEYPTEMIVNVWGMNPDGSPDKTAAFGDVDGDFVLDWVPPESLSSNVVNVTDPPPHPYLGYRVVVNDGNYSYSLEPAGSAWIQLALGLCIGLIPFICAVAGVMIYRRSFYQVKFNEIGVSNTSGIAGLPIFTEKMKTAFSWNKPSVDAEVRELAGTPTGVGGALAAAAGGPNRRSVLIATIEYEIEDWNIKVKIGGLGVMASLMGKNLAHQDLIWVVPCVGDIEYPIDQPGEVMTVTILGQVYEIEVQYHQVRNITYILLDSPVFRKQTKKEPYPARMDDLESAIYYSAWNSCIAQAMDRFPIDLYHVNDYHGTLAPLYILPRTVPICLSLHNAEFQGLWPVRNQKEMDEICKVFNLPEDVVRKYVQFGEVFNLLHAAASYLRVHQKGFGAVGVSKKYGKRAYARYPIFWGLSSIGPLPNPDPSDTAEWHRDSAAIDTHDLKIDETAEAERGVLRRQAQEWAGLEVDPTAELFVFVGRWSQQKGVDLIADVFFSVLEENPKVQLICIGPVIDLYGKFAALKLDKMMKKYPTRVFSKPEFTALPPFIFSGAEFALIPSRDEPFGLVAVEFGRKGALGVGSRVGGLGQMPGWWFTIESTTTDHVLHQFKSSIRDALASKRDVRAMMRIRSGLQRFPVAQWVEDLETLQTRSIAMHSKPTHGISTILGFSLPGSAVHSPVGTAPNSVAPTRANSAVNSPRGSRAPSPTRIYSNVNSASSSRAPSPTRASSNLNSGMNSRASSPTRANSNVNTATNNRASTQTLPVTRPGAGALSSVYEDEAQYGPSSSKTGLPLPHSRAAGMKPHSRTPTRNSSFTSLYDALERHQRADGHHLNSAIPQNEDDGSGSPVRISFDRRVHSPTPLTPGSPYMTPTPSRPSTPPPGPDGLPFGIHKSRSVLSLQSIVGEKTDFNLQQVDPFFTDPTNEFFTNFEHSLEGVTAKNSESKFCIEKYLAKSEKAWFAQRHNAKLGKSLPAHPSSFPSTPTPSVYEPPSTGDISGLSQFALGNDFVPFTGLKRIMQLKICDWQVYTILLAFGQIIAANSYQINLITGANGEAAIKLYIVAGIYLVSSIFWWLVFRRLRSVFVLSTPFGFYGLAFFLLGMAPYVSDTAGRGWLYNVATGAYAIASASGSFFFALNFGSEGGAPVKAWVFRACAVQGTQQIYVVALWYWGSKLTSYTTNGGTTNNLITSSPVITAIMVPIALFLWVIGFLIYFGLPDFYSQKPGKVPSFYMSILRRKIVLWFMVMVILQNYWLSAPYGRNWRYLFSSSQAPAWSIVLIVLFFFVFVWFVMLFGFASLSRHHSWILPIFAIGLGAPRWCQMLWGTSNIGLYVPWGGQVWGAILGRGLWAWLGTLDAIQGVGFGMILLQTLARYHITFTLVSAQVIGSIATIVARATAPNNIGPGTVFPDFTAGWRDGMSEPSFWMGFLFQLVICVGFFHVFQEGAVVKTLERY